MKTLVDSSVWISYFRSGKREDILDYLIDENLIATNDVILSELIPFIKIHNKHKLIEHLQAVEKLAMNIDWPYIIEVQTSCLKKGINGIGIPDLIIAQNAIQHEANVFSEDKHFLRIAEVSDLQVYQKKSLCELCDTFATKT